MTKVRSQKKKLGEKLKQVYKELKIEESKDLGKVSAANIDAVTQGNLTVVQLKEEESKPNGLQTLIDAISKLIENLSGKLSSSPSGNNNTEAKVFTPGEHHTQMDGKNWLQRGISTYKKEKTDSFKQMTSVEGIASMIGITPGVGIAGTLVGAYAEDTKEKEQKKAEKEDYIKNFKEFTDVGRSMTDEESTSRATELYEKETKTTSRISEIENKKKLADVFGGTLSKKDTEEYESLKTVMNDITREKSFTKETDTTNKENVPLKTKGGKKTVVSEEEQLEAIRTEFINSVMSGIDQGIAEATPEEKLELENRGGSEFVSGVKDAVYQELINLNKEQLEELKKIALERTTENQEKESEDKSSEIVAEHTEKQTELLKDISTGTKESEETTLEKNIKTKEATTITTEKVTDKTKEKSSSLISTLMDMVPGGALKKLGPVGTILGSVLGKGAGVAGTIAKAGVPLMGSALSAAAPLAAVGTAGYAGYKVGGYINDNLLTNDDGASRVATGLESVKGVFGGGFDDAQLEATKKEEIALVNRQIASGSVSQSVAKLADKHGIKISVPIQSKAAPIERALAATAVTPESTTVNNSSSTTVAIPTVEQVTPKREAIINEMKEAKQNLEKAEEKKLSDQNKQSTHVINNSPTTNISNNSSRSEPMSTSRPADTINEDRYNFLQRRTVF